MTLFEYLSVAFSIVLSLSGVRLLAGLSVSFVPGRRCWFYTVWLGSSLLLIALVWWNFWSFRNAQWNFLSFLLVLLVPGSIYLMAVALVPDSPGSVISWEDQFFAARTRFFTALAMFFALITASSWILLDLPLVHPIRGVHTLAFGLALTGAISTRRRYHEALAIAFVMLELAVAATLFLEPDALVPLT